MSNLFERLSQLAPNRLALLVLDLQSKLEALEGASTAPIAVIGLGCRFPGGADGPARYWDLLAEGRDAISEVPASRWNVDGLFDPDPDAPGKIASRWGGFVEHLDEFDADFFGISPREAMSLDPQQRLTLEVGWEALEHAGYAPDRLAGSSTGVFLGVCNGDYGRDLLTREPELLDAYVATGSAYSVASGRLSYLLGLQGPSISVDTACSSSLVAVHLAVQSLRTGDCRMALAGGVNAILSPDITMALSRARMMASDGRCKAFDASADGFVRAEGCGFVVLKRLKDALADGDSVLAVIRGSAINQDGRSNGITAPNGPSQVAVIKQALANAGLKPSDVDYVETHGTGTSLGDPIEVQALGAALGADRPADRPLAIGSVKTNLGHLESAAGIAGLIKAILAVQHATIPRHLHFTTPSPHIPWQKLNVTVPQQQMPWPATPDGRRVAGVSSFGFSGTNAHVLIEAAPVSAASASTEERPLHLVSLSAKTASALKTSAGHFADALSTEPAASLADIAYTANVGRADFEHRLAIIARTTEDVRQALDEYRSGTGSDRALVSPGPVANRVEVAFLFTAQGAQYRDMGRQLYATQPTFRRALDRCAEIVSPHLDRPLLSVIWSPEHGLDDAHGLLDQTAYTQPALFAIQYALVQLWQSWGIKPAAVLGHSAGELVAACVAGVISLEDGLRLSAVRGRLMQTLTPPGAMASVRADEHVVRSAIAPVANLVSIAAINGTESVTIAGDRSAVRAVVQDLAARSIEARELAISIASHSPLMDPMLDAFERSAQDVTFSAPRIELVSGMTGEVVGPATISAHYFRRHARESVQFVRALRELRQRGYRHFLEIGPSPTLVTLGRQALPDESAVWLHSLRRGNDDWEQLLASLGTLYVEGADVDWAGFDRDYQHSKVALPTYPFERERYWIDTTARRPIPATRPDEGNTHPLLGHQLRSPALEGTVHEATMRPDSPAFLRDHHVFGTVILPSPVTIEMALAAGRVALASGDLELENLSIRSPLVLPEGQPRIVQTVLKAESATTQRCQIYSRPEDSDIWHLHAEVRVAKASARGSVRSRAETPRLADVQARCDEPLDGGAYYDAIRQLGLEFGPAFRGIRRIWRGTHEALGEIALAESLKSTASSYQIHPAMLDACFQLMGAALPNPDESQTYLLVGFDRFRISGRAGDRLSCHVRVRTDRPSSTDGWLADLILFDEGGAVIGQAEGLSIRPARKDSVQGKFAALRRDWLYETQWVPASQDRSESEATAAWLPAPGTVEQHLRATVERLERTHLTQEFVSLLPELERLGRDYAWRALQNLGMQRCADDRVALSPDNSPASVQGMAQHLGVVPRHQRLLARIVSEMLACGYLRQTDDVLMAFGPPASHETLADRVRQLAAAHPTGAAELRILEQCGERLAEVLRGEIDPLHVLFPGGSSVLVQPLYEHSPSGQYSNELMGATLERLLTDLPKSARLRVLEVGAGTGATTASLLQHLPAERAEYLFTDVSPLLVSRAAERFAAHEELTYQVLDIEDDPSMQGLAGRSFDLIVAANVLHATANVAKSVEHIRKLLAPGGVLLLLEATTPWHWIDLTFGLTEGWWNFSDTCLRSSHPLLTSDTWLDLLSRSGFASATAVVGPDGTTAVTGQAVILAQADGEPVARRQDAIPTRWTLFGNSDGVTDALVAQLTARGDSYRLVVPGSQFAELAPSRLQIDPAAAEDYRRLFCGLPSQDGGRHHVVHLWSIDSPANELLGAADLQARTLHNTGSALLLAQAAIDRRDAASPLTLWCVTRGGQSVEDSVSPASLAQAPLWGLGRVIALEHPELWGGSIDLDAAAPDRRNAADLIGAILAGDDEDQVALREGTRYVARLVPTAPAVREPVHLRADATYVIVGGLGGLGLGLGRWMAEQGARSIVLLSRGGMPDRAEWSALPSESRVRQQADAIQAIEALGASVTVLRADLTDEWQLRTAFENLAQTHAPVRGIVHAAAELDIAPIRTLSIDALSRQFGPKILGTWLLHQATAHLSLDFFALYSSTTSLLGVSGLGHYAAANEFLSSVAQYRRTIGLPGLSIRWGTWDTMRATSADQRESYRQFGLHPMDSGEAHAILGALLGSPEGASDITVASIDWSILKPSYEARRRRPLLAELGRQEEASVSTPTVVEPTLLAQIEAARPGERPGLVRALVEREVTRVLRLPTTREIDPQRGFFEMGMDSLMAVELKSRLEGATGLSLPSSLTFNYPNVGTLTEYLTSRVLQKFAPDTQTAEVAAHHLAPPTRPEAPCPVDDDLSEDELADMLSARLARMS